MENDIINQALYFWLGDTKLPYPTRNDDAVIERFGDDAEKILIELHNIETVFYKSNAYLKAKDLEEMGVIAKNDFRLSNYNLSEDSLNLLASCYTYDFK